MMDMGGPTPYCMNCRGAHWASECPDVRQSSLTNVRQSSLTKVKKEWIKPEIRRYVRVDSLTGDPFVKLGEVARFDKRKYQREYMKRKRDEANRVG